MEPLGISARLGLQIAGNILESESRQTGCLPLLSLRVFEFPHGMVLLPGQTMVAFEAQGLAGRFRFGDVSHDRPLAALPATAAFGSIRSWALRVGVTRTRGVLAHDAP